jgi:hypothetical protein
MENRFIALLKQPEVRGRKVAPVRTPGNISYSLRQNRMNFKALLVKNYLSKFFLVLSELKKAISISSNQQRDYCTRSFHFMPIYINDAMHCTLLHQQKTIQPCCFLRLAKTSFSRLFCTKMDVLHFARFHVAIYTPFNVV